MRRLVFALLLAPSAGPEAEPEARAQVEIQRPGEAVTWALDWHTPPSCPTREEVISAIRAYLPELDDPPQAAPRADLRVHAQLVQGDSEWSARLEMSGREGATERRFSALTCDELADAVALVAAVSLDPVLVARELSVGEERLTTTSDRASAEPAPTPAPPPTPTPTTDPLDLHLSVVEAPTPSSEARAFEIGLRVQGGGGFGPTTTGYGALGASFALFARRWRWQLDGGWWIPRTVTSADEVGRFQGWWLGTRGCFVPSWGRLELPACAGAEGGQVFAQGLPPTNNPRDASYPWFAATLSPGLTWAFTDRFALSAEAALLLPLVRGNFRVGQQDVQSLTPVGVRALLGFELRL